MANSPPSIQSDLSEEFQSYYEQMGALLQQVKIKEDELKEAKELLQLRDEEIAMLKKTEGENNVEIMRLLDETDSLRRKLLKAMRNHQSSLELFRDRAQGFIAESLDLWGKLAGEIESLKNPPPYASI